MSAPPTRSARDTLLRAELVEKAVELVRDGASYRQVAEALGVGVATAHAYVQKALAAIPKASADALRTQEELRLESLWDKLALDSPRTVKAFDEEGNPVEFPVWDERTIETARKISESRRKLHGLDAPQQVQADVRVGYTVNGVDPEKLR